MKMNLRTTVSALRSHAGTLTTLLVLSMAHPVLALDALFSAPAPMEAEFPEGGTPAGIRRLRNARINWPAVPSQARPAVRPRRALAAAGDQPDVVLNAFGDRQVPVIVTRVVSKGPDEFRVYGRVPETAASQVILSVKQGIMAGSVYVEGEKPLQITYAGDGWHAIAEIDPALVPGCGGEAIAPPANLPPGDVIPPVAGAPATQIDIMVVYTAAARTGAGGTTAMQTLIDLAVAEANSVYGNSAIDVNLNLVYRGEVTYTESGSASTDLTRLQVSGDGQLDTVQGLRATYGADAVILITEQMTTYAGLAYIMSPVSTAFSDFAYGVVKRANATGSYVFVHELGHIMGCAHDRDNATSGGAYAYSYGHRFDASGTTYRTVMAYAPGTRIPYFSNPTVSYLGVASGVAAGATNAADNATSINNTAATVAAFAGDSTFLAFDSTSTNVTEADTTVTLRVLRTGPTNVTSTVRFSTAGLTASAGTDYTATNGTLTFDPGDTEKTFDVAVRDDASVETSETFTLTLASPTNAVLGVDKTYTITIQDDDTGITIPVATTSVSEGATNLTVSVWRTGESSGTNTVDYVTTDGTALSGSDYTSTTGTLTFNAGVTNATITIPITDDASLEANETFRVILSNPGGGAALYGTTNLLVTVLENDGTIAFSTNAVAVNEATTTATLTVLRTGSTNTAVSVDYLTLDGTASDGVDYTSTNGTLTLAAGVASKTLTVTLINDSTVDGDLAFSVTLTNAVGADLGTHSSVTVTQKDNDSAFAFATNTVAAGEAAGTLSLSVLRTGGVGGAATVKYASTNGTAQAGSDFVNASGTLTFAAGETNKTISLKVTDDASVESDEDLDVVLSAPTGEGTLGATDTVTVTIADNDNLLSFETNRVTVLESAGSAVLTINRTGTLTGTNTVAYTIKAGTATAADYTATNGVLTFAPNATNATLTLSVVNDALVESSETFSVVLGTPSAGAHLSGTNTAYITISENDVGLAFAAATYTVSEGASNIVLTIVQTGDTNATSSVNYATADGGAVDGSDFTATSGTLNFGAGTNSLTITVPILDDSSLETNEAFTVVLSGVSGASLVTPSTATVRILEDDSVLSLSTNALAASESLTNAVLTVLRTGGTNYSVTVDFATADGTAAAGVDYVSTNGTVTLPAGVKSKTFTVPLINDSTVDGDLAFTVSLTNAVGAVLGTYTNATVTQKDNDSTFAFETNAVSVAESGGTLSLKVLRTGGVAGAATVKYATTNATATAGSDYTGASGTLSFAAGETNKTISLKITDDASVESDEDLDVVLSAPTGEGTLGGTDTVTVTIADNDSLLSFETNRVTVLESAGSAVLTINRTGTLSGTNTVAYTIKAGTATAADHTGANGTITFAPNATNATLTLSVVNDAVVEGSETFMVVLGTPSKGASLSGTNTAYITITENDVGLAFSAATYSVSEGASNVVLTVVQTGDTNATSSVNYTTADGGAAGGSDFTATSGTLNFGSGTNSLTITVPITDDASLETNETFTVVLSGAVGASTLSPSTATVRILEDDSVLSLSTNALAVNENITNAVLTLVRTGGTNAAVTVDFATADGTAAAGVDYVSTNGTVTLPAGVKSKTFTVPLINDSTVDGDLAFTVSLTNAVGAVLGTYTNATVTQKDNDSTFAFETNAVSVAESGGTLSLKVLRTGGVAGAATVKYATTNATATAGSDYTGASGTLSFAAGETNKTISLKVTDDASVESDEDLDVVLSAPTGEGTLGGTDTVTVTIADNDSLLSFETNRVTVLESAGSAVLTINRTGTLSGTNTVAYTIKAGTATAADYTATNGVLTFAPNATNATLTLSVVNDAVVEGSETFSVVLGTPSTGAHLSGTNTAYITITENDVGLAFSAATYTVSEGASNVVLTVVQTGDLDATASVNYTTADGGAAGGSDFTATSGTLNFGSGTNSLTITVPITDDASLETNETFTVVLSGAVGASALSPSTATVRILEDDAVLTLSTNVLAVNENITNAVLTVVRTGGTNAAVTVDFATADGTAAAGVDYVSTNGTVTLPAGVKSKTFTVPLINDSTVDGDLAFTVSLTNAVGAVLGTYTNATVTQKDNDSTFAFETNAVSVAESGGTLSLKVLRTGGVAGAATVKYATTNATATAGSDYTGASGTLSFAAGETNKTISLKITDDASVESDEDLDVVLSAPTGEGTLGGTDTVTVTIADNDSLLSFETNRVTVLESAGSAVLTINRTGTLSGTNTVAYTIKAGTATAADYTATNGVLTFAPNATNATLTLPVVNDSAVESSETFSVMLGTPSTGAHLSGTNTAYITITENDVGLAFSAATYTVGEGASNIVLTVVQTGDLDATASVNYTTADGGAAGGSDFTATSGTLNFGSGTNSLTITVPITDDASLETNETFTVVLSGAVGASTLSPSTATVRILEDDAVLTLSTNAFAVNENITNAVLTVVRTGGTNAAVTVDFATADGTAAAGVDYVSTNGTVTLPAGVKSKTFTVPLINDSTVDGDLAFTVSLTNAVGAVLGTYTNATVTQKDNDSTFAFETNAVSVAESGGTLSLKVLRTGGVAGAATVKYATTNATASAGSDYTGASGTLSFAAGETNKTISLKITDDASVESDEDLDVVLSAPTGEGTLGGTDTVTVTIADNDSLLSFETNRVTVLESAGSAVLTINRTGTLSGTNTVAYTIKAGTATAADYTATNGVLTFAPNATNATLTLPVVNDALVESTETFTVVLGKPSLGATLSGTNTAYITITENDVGLAFSAATYAVGEGASNIVLTVVQTGDLDATASVNYATADGGAVDGSDFTAVSGTLNFGSGTNSLTITVPITDDAAIETNETFTVVLSGASGATLLTPGTALVRILEDDSTLAFTTNAVSALESASSITLTVLRTGGTNYAATVDFATADATATAGDDYTSTNATLSFAPGERQKTITVPLSNDTSVEGDETFSVTLESPSGAALGAVTNAVATLRDNDSVIGFSTNAVAVAENAGTTTLTLVRTGGVAGPASIRLSTTNGTATAASDYTARTLIVSFKAGETNKTVAISILNDTSVEDAETFTVGLASPTGEATVGTGVTTLTINDNDFNLGGQVVEKGVARVSLNTLSWQADVGVRLEIEGPLGAAVIVETSSNLVDWIPIGEMVLGGAPVWCLDAEARELSHGFYRLRQPAATAADDGQN